MLRVLAVSGIMQADRAGQKQTRTHTGTNRDTIAGISQLCTAALAVRRWARHESSKPVEGYRAVAVTIGVLILWLLGPTVLGILWWRSMPYHDERLTLWAAFWLWLTVVAVQRSIYRVHAVMRSGGHSPDRPRGRAAVVSEVAGATGALAVLAVISWFTTERGGFPPLVPASMAGAELSHKRADWLHYDMWLEEWEHAFRVRESLPLAGSDESWTEDEREQFRDETARRWETLTQSLASPDLKGKDLRTANLRAAFMSGADLGEARLEGANLRDTRLEGANLQ